MNKRYMVRTLIIFPKNVYININTTIKYIGLRFRLSSHFHQNFIPELLSRFAFKSGRGYNVKNSLFG